LPLPSHGDYWRCPQHRPGLRALALSRRDGGACPLRGRQASEALHLSQSAQCDERDEARTAAAGSGRIEPPTHFKAWHPQSPRVLPRREGGGRAQTLATLPAQHKAEIKQRPFVDARDARALLHRSIGPNSRSITMNIANMNISARKIPGRTSKTSPMTMQGR